MVEKIAGHKVVAGELYFLIKWVNYDELSWEPYYQLLNAKLILKQYFNKLKKDLQKS